MCVLVTKLVLAHRASDILLYRHCTVSRALSICVCLQVSLYVSLSVAVFLWPCSVERDRDSMGGERAIRVSARGESDRTESDSIPTSTDREESNR